MKHYIQPISGWDWINTKTGKRHTQNTTPCHACLKTMSWPRYPGHAHLKEGEICGNCVRKIKDHQKENLGVICKRSGAKMSCPVKGRIGKRGICRECMDWHYSLEQCRMGDKFGLQYYFS